MAFDKTLDKEIWKEESEYETTKVTVTVMRYDKNPAKIQIIRMVRDTDEHDWRFSKLGRINQEEIDNLILALQKAKKELEAYNGKENESIQI